MVEYSNYNDLKQQHYFNFVDDPIVAIPTTIDMFHGNPISNILVEENLCYSANNR